jgi:hypothetical protein
MKIPIIDKIEALSKHAVSGKWHVEEDRKGGVTLYNDEKYNVNQHLDEECRYGSLTKPDADFIAAMQNNIHLLLAVAKAAAMKDEVKDDVALQNALEELAKAE